MKVIINDGQNVIQNLNDGFLNALIINQPLAINWPDCEGSVGEYYSVSNFSIKKREELTNSLNEVLINGNEDQIFTNIIPFLKLFSNGEYNITLEFLKLAESVFHHDEKMIWGTQIKENEKFTCWFYPSYGWDYFFTRPYKTIDKERVIYYKNLIEAGIRPKVILYQLYHLNTCQKGAGYILDGHHKLLAYLELKIDVNMVYITKDISGNQEIVKDLLPTVYGFLKPIEFEHIIQNNPQAYFEKNDFTSLANTTLDDIISTKNSIDYEINKLLIDVINLKSKNYDDWLSKRMTAIKKNKYIGKGFYLLTKGYSETHKCEAWNSFPINNIADIKRWIDAVSIK